METLPTLLILFNRPHHTHELIQNLRLVKPNKIYISCDGPRESISRDYENVLAVRRCVENIDWPCEIKRQFFETNQGCRFGPSRAISWFFEMETEGVILEDDIRFDPSFFWFCKVLLQEYREVREIGCVCGYNFIDEQHRTESYRFSRIPLTWGWATWRDRWNEGQRCLNSFENLIKKLDLSWLQFSHDRRETLRKLTRAFSEDHVWDFLWMFYHWSTNRYAIIPKCSLSSNHGIGDDATHTNVATSFLHQDHVALSGEFKKPRLFEVDLCHDQKVFAELLHKPSLYERFLSFTKNPNKLKKAMEIASIRLGRQR